MSILPISVPQYLTRRWRMGEHVLPAQAVASDLRNEETEKKFDFIRKLGDLGVSRYVALPQLVVVGDQSSGKSSVLQAVTRLPFPVNDRMCTRFATEVILQRSDEPLSTTIAIDVKEDHEQQHSAAHDQRMRHWRPQNFNPTDTLDGPTFARIIKDAGDVILAGSRENQLMSTATLKIIRKGPEEVNLAIVDIPGLVSVEYDKASHEANLAAVQLVNEYVKNPKSIILAVAHPVDPDNQEVFQMLNGINDKEHRVIGVITKCDRKQEGAENWIFDTIRNRRAGNPHYLSQGWFGLRNRLPVEKNISDEARDEREASFFRQGVWAALGRPTKLGISHLKTALTKMLDDHLTKSIPALIPEVEEQLEICKSKLGQLGLPRSSPSEQLSCMVRLASEFSKLSTYALDGQYDRLPEGPEVKIRKIVHDALENFRDNMRQDYENAFGMEAACTFKLKSTDSAIWCADILEDDLFREIQAVINDNRGKESPGEVNPCVLRLLWSRKTASWIRRASKAVNDLIRCISAAVERFFEGVCREEDLRKNTQRWLKVHLQSVSKYAREELERIVADERNGLVWTLNPQRLSRMRKINQQRIDKMTQDLLEFSSDPENVQRWSKTVNLWLAANSHIVAIFDTHDRLASYYEISMYRFIDNVGHQVIERHLLGPTSPLRIFTPEYVVETLQEDHALLNTIAGEKESKLAERAALVAEENSLKVALEAAREYGYFGN